MDPAKPDGIAIVVLTHNRVGLLRQCVENVLLRTSGATREIVVWDNASTDGTAEYLDSLNDPRIRVLRSEKNVGMNGYARSFSATEAAYLVELDDDVVGAPQGWDEMLRDAFDRLPEIGYLAADLEDDPLDEASQYRHRLRAHEYTPFEMNGVKLLSGPAGGGCAMTSRVLSDRVGGFRERPDEVFWIEDGAYVADIERLGFRSAVLADLRVHHTGGSYYTSASREKEEFWSRYWARRARRENVKRLLVRLPLVRRLNARFNWFVAPPEREDGAGRLREHMRLGTTVSALAPGPAGRAWFFAMVLLLPLRKRLLPGTPVPVRLGLSTGATWFWLRDGSELIALEEIFCGGEYAAVDGREAETIVDLGANVGQAALWLRGRFPDARILSVEPDPRTFATLRRNLGADPHVTVRRAAITAEDGDVRLERTPESSWGTRVTSAADADVTGVPGISLETLLDEHGLDQVDVLKVDIEGLEHDALGASPALSRVRFVIGEVHPDLLALPVGSALEDMRRCGGFDSCELDGDIFVLSRDQAPVTAISTA